MADLLRTGLRLLELETAISRNLDVRGSAELVDYDSSRVAGQAARLAMLIRGQDVIEDEQRLKKLAAVELGISASEYSVIRRFLLDADLVQEGEHHGRTVLLEKVERLDHAANYRRVADVWTSRDTTDKERALVATLDRLVDAPSSLTKLTELTGLTPDERNAVLEVGANSALIDKLDQQEVFFTPLLWDVEPKKLSKFLTIAEATAFSQLLVQLKHKPGSDFTAAGDQIVQQAISAGILPTYGVRSAGGPRQYAFAPYSGTLLTSDSEKTILDKARAIVACLRYGTEAAVVSRIGSPQAIIGALVNSNRGYRIGPHSEYKGQYGMLVARQIGKIAKASIGGRYYFELIPTKDNLRACKIASELLRSGELMGHKDPGGDTAIELIKVEVNQPIQEVKVAKKKRAPRADELAGLIEGLRSV